MGKIGKDIQKRLPQDVLQPGEQLIEASWLDRPSAWQHLKALLTTGHIPHQGERRLLSRRRLGGASVGLSARPSYPSADVGV